jgi:hypothetical protein
MPYELALPRQTGFGGAAVWFRELRWREIPSEEQVAADPKFVPLPVTGEALKKEQERVRRMLEAQNKKP